MLFIVDRKKEMLISGGMNVFLRQIEDLMAEHANVRESAVFGIHDERWGDAVKAVIVLELGQELTFEELRDHVKRVQGSSYDPSPSPSSMPYLAAPSGRSISGA
jgi:acyl-CoA synthetase (AMP-forming)/AMP-acid ligase II